ILTSVVGTKGAGTVTKTGSSTPKPTVQQVRNMTDTAISNYVNPFGPELVVSHGVHVPHGVLNGPTLKDELLLFAKDFKSGGNGRLNAGGEKAKYIGDIKHLYSSIKQSPKYPTGFKGVQ